MILYGNVVIILLLYFLYSIVYVCYLYFYYFIVLSLCYLLCMCTFIVLHRM